MSFIIYKSSAGSGKTFTLVKEFLSVILKNPSKYSRILAITFTNKAAAEMKERILSYLQELAEEKNYQLKADWAIKEQIQEQTGLSNEEIYKNAEICLTNILHNYSLFSVSTIDSFIHKVIQSFSFDLYLPESFHVEMEQEQILSQAIRNMMQQAVNQPELADFILHFIENEMSDDRSWNIHRSLMRLGKQLFNEEAQHSIRSLESYQLSHYEGFIKKMNAFLRQYQKFMKTKGQEAFSLIQNHGIEVKDFYYSNSGVGRYFEKLSQGLVLDANSRILMAFNEDMWYSKSAKQQTKDKIDSISSELHNILKAIFNYEEEHKTRFYLFKMLKRQIFSMAVLSFIQQQINRIKKEKQAVLISEFNRIIADVVFKEPIPFIYERIGEHFQHFFIDEFQDTSVLQFHNFLPLLHNSLSYGHMNLIVGDAKQSIYRFRNGQYEQFIQLPNIENENDSEIIKQRQAVLVRNAKQSVLAKNFRTKKTVVEFNNDFFRFCTQFLPEVYRKVYDEVEQTPHKTEGGYVNLQLFDVENQEEKFEDYVNETVLRKIKEQQKNGFLPGDMAVLCRRNKEISRIGTYLSENGIQIESAEALELRQSKDIQFVISLIRTMLNPQDKISLMEVLVYLLDTKQICLDLSTFTKKRILAHNTLLLDKILNENQISFSVQNLYHQDIYNCCAMIIRHFVHHYQSNAFMLEFLNLVFDFSQKENNHLSAFLEWWNQNEHKLYLQNAENRQAVKLMTIHKSKGLEFPVVIYPAFDNKKNTPTKNYLWTNLKDAYLPNLNVAVLKTTQEMMKTPLEDEFLLEVARTRVDVMNSYYVAMTRASEQLHIIACLHKKTESFQLSNFLVNYLHQNSLFQPEKLEYEFGKAEKYVGKDVKQTDYMLVLDNSLFDKQQFMPLIKLSALQEWDVNHPDEMLQWGSVLHKTLSFIYDKNDVDAAIEKAMKKNILSENRKDYVKELLLQIVHHPALSFMFSEQYEIKNEWQIVSKDGNFIPDRLVFDDNKVHIIDYKTGQYTEKHSRQINQYAALLNEMDFEVQSKKLVYLQNPVEVVVVD